MAAAQSVLLNEVGRVRAQAVKDYSFDRGTDCVRTEVYTCISESPPNAWGQ